MRRRKSTAVLRLQQGWRARSARVPSRRMDESGELKHPPLEAEHRRAWRETRPVRRLEHADRVRGRACGAPRRPRAGRVCSISPISGKVEVDGPGALALLQGVVTNDVAAIDVGEAQYNLVLNEGGGVIEDLIVYRMEPTAVLRRAERIEHAPGAADPRRGRDAGHGAPDVPPGLVLPRGPGPGVAGASSRRLFPEAAGSVVHALHRVLVPPPAGDRHEIRIHGRDRLRAVHLPGHRRRPLARGCSTAVRAASAARRAGSRRATSSASRWATRCTARTSSSPRPRSRRACRGRCRWTRGRSAVARRSPASAQEGLPSRLRGLRMHERRHIPRAHYPVFVGDRVIGEVTSGTFSPLLQTGIGARLPLARATSRRRRRGRGRHPGPARCGDGRASAVRGPKPALGGSERPGRSRGPCPCRTARCGACGERPPGPGAFGVDDDDQVQPRAGDARARARGRSRGRRRSRTTAGHVTRVGRRCRSRCAMKSPGDSASPAIDAGRVVHEDPLVASRVHRCAVA